MSATHWNSSSTKWAELHKLREEGKALTLCKEMSIQSNPLQPTTEICILGVPISRELRIRPPPCAIPVTHNAIRIIQADEELHQQLHLKFVLKKNHNLRIATPVITAEVMKLNMDDAMYFIWTWSHSSNFYDFLGSFLAIEWMENERVCDFLFSVSNFDDISPIKKIVASTTPCVVFIVTYTICEGPNLDA